MECNGPDYSPALVERLLSARRVAVLTGAGMSAESGVPTFRDPGGLWEKFRPEELANVEAFLNNPELVQGWYAHRRDVVTHSSPNSGHVALAKIARFYEKFSVITQNVDGLHTRAGSQNVIELHGNLTRNYCIDCGHRIDNPEMPEDGQLCCSACGGLIRPDVVWFGEMLPAEAIVEAERATRSADVFLSIGTSSVVFPAADFPIMARRSGAYVAEINISRSAIAHHSDETIIGKAGEVLPDLLATLEKHWNVSAGDSVM